ncbi:MAG: small subunit ribosomal protein S4 [Parcubacteria group bacterium LiPW_15]|nr:MAG: small subunit ribosomal protein S4 [Parcubacteria group bacterium LiPW_15]
MLGPKEKKERALGERLHLKGTRCDGPKCAAVRRPYPPGAHGQGRHRALSDFGKQLKEKQKFKLTYLLDERNLSRIFGEAVKNAKVSAGGVGAKFVELLERRLDNVVFRMGLAPSRLAARQLVLHGHIFVNGRRSRAPGNEVCPDDTISVRKESLSEGPFRDLKEKLKTYDMPKWLALNPENLEGRMTTLPTDVDMPFEVSLLVEAFSK